MIDIRLIRSPTDGDWLQCRNYALHTIREKANKTPSFNLRQKYLASKHSPIRTLIYAWEWVDLPTWISVHFVRHNVGYQSHVASQRNDRQSNYDRRKAPQDAPVNHIVELNAESLINVSAKRMCLVASVETQLAWKMAIDLVIDISPEIAPFLVKPCVSMGGICPEVFGGCRYNSNKKFEKEVKEYKDLFLKLKHG